MRTKLSYCGLGRNVLYLSLIAVYIPTLQLGADTIVDSDRVRLFGVTISPELSLDRRVSGISVTNFYWLRRVRRLRCSRVCVQPD